MREERVPHVCPHLWRERSGWKMPANCAVLCPSRPLLCWPPGGRQEEQGASVEHQIELSGRTFGRRSRGGSREALSAGTYAKWFGDIHRLSSKARRSSSPSRASSRATGSRALPRPDRRGRARSPASSILSSSGSPAMTSRLRRTSEVAGPSFPWSNPCGARERRHNAKYVRFVRHRLVEPLRPRGRARGRGGAGAGVQPAVHLRRHGPRQDASSQAVAQYVAEALVRALRCAT
jgi:hypothetical protein